MNMGLWVAIFITLVVFGSVLWVKPSPREKTLTQLRNSALAKGLKVRLVDAKLAASLFPWIDNYRLFVFYEKNLPAAAKPKSHKAIVIRLSEDPNAHELDEENPIKSALINKIDVTTLPSTIEALVISASGIAIVWKEFKQGDLDVFQQLELIEGFLDECIINKEIWT